MIIHLPESSPAHPHPQRNRKSDHKENKFDDPPDELSGSKRRAEPSAKKSDI